MDCSEQRPFIAEGDRTTLERWVRMPTVAQRVVRRSRIVLLLDEGLAGIVRHRRSRSTAR